MNLPAYQPTLLPGVVRVGIDPGLTGAIAVVDDDQVLEVRAMPRRDGLHGEGAVDAEVLVRLLRALRSAHNAPRVYLEDVGGFRSDAASRAFAFGRAVGVLEAALVSSGLPVTLVHPATWKARLRLTKLPKAAARDRACEVYPSAYPHVRASTGAADAILIAHIGPDLSPTLSAAPAPLDDGDPF